LQCSLFESNQVEKSTEKKEKKKKVKQGGGGGGLVTEGNKGIQSKTERKKETSK